MANVMAVGRMAYGQVWELQKRLVEQRIAGEIGDTVVLCEHDPVYTLGRRRDAAQNLLNIGDTPVFEIERGGDVTWHGPGQVVAYPIVRLDPLDLHAHLRRLEDVMITACAAFGLSATRDPRNSGVWVNGRKLGSVGVACRSQVTFHGLALNVNPDLSWFHRINPCGFSAEIMTSMEAEAGQPVALDAVRSRIIARFLGW